MFVIVCILHDARNNSSPVERLLKVLLEISKLLEIFRLRCVR